MEISDLDRTDDCFKASHPDINTATVIDLSNDSRRLGIDSHPSDRPARSIRNESSMNQTWLPRGPRRIETIITHESRRPSPQLSVRTADRPNTQEPTGAIAPQHSSTPLGRSLRVSASRAYRCCTATQYSVRSAKRGITLTESLHHLSRCRDGRPTSVAKPHGGPGRPDRPARPSAVDRLLTDNRRVVGDRAALEFATPGSETIVRASLYDFDSTPDGLTRLS